MSPAQKLNMSLGPTLISNHPVIFILVVLYFDHIKYVHNMSYRFRHLGLPSSLCPITEKTSPSQDGQTSSSREPEKENFCEVNRIKQDQTGPRH